MKTREFRRLFLSIEKENRSIINNILGKALWVKDNYDFLVFNERPNLLSRVLTLAKWLELNIKGNLFNSKTTNCIDLP